MLRLKEETDGWEVTVEGILFQDLIADGRKEDLYSCVLTAIKGIAF